MTAQQHIEPEHAARARAPRPHQPPAQKLARRLGLKLTEQEQLTLRRQRRGKGFCYLRADGRIIRDPATLRRLRSLAVPPAYEDVRYAEDPAGHLQAIGRDAAGRLQYRYHPKWEEVREARKARRLLHLIDALPTIRRSVAQHLANEEPCREFALAAVIELVARSAIRSGSESYARLNGTRGATTLLKSNVSIEKDTIALSFRAKGGKATRKELCHGRLAAALGMLQRLPGKRLFQFRAEDGAVRMVSSPQVNEFLREIAGCSASLKDFRTLMGCSAALELLAATAPATSARQRRKQVLEAMRSTAAELANTPAIARKSYVHRAIVTAFEDGKLARFAMAVKSGRLRREQLLADVIAEAAE